MKTYFSYPLDDSRMILYLWDFQFYIRIHNSKKCCANQMVFFEWACFSEILAIPDQGKIFRQCRKTIPLVQVYFRFQFTIAMQGIRKLVFFSFFSLLKKNILIIFSMIFRNKWKYTVNSMLPSRNYFSSNHTELLHTKQLPTDLQHPGWLVRPSSRAVERIWSISVSVAFFVAQSLLSYHSHAILKCQKLLESDFYLPSQVNVLTQVLE